MEGGTMSKRFFSAGLSIMCLVLGSMLAQAQPRAYRGTYQSVRQLILRIESRSDLFRNGLQARVNRNSNETYGANEDINLFVSDFYDSVHRLHDRFNRRQSTSTDAQEVLNRAARIDAF